MKRTIIMPFALSAMLLTACTGEPMDQPADANAETSILTAKDIMESETSTEEKEEAKEESTEAAIEATVEAKASTSESADSAAVSVSIDGTWQTASIGYMDGDDMQPDFYVEFKDSSIDYGHMKDGQFTIDHSDKISSAEKTSNGYVIKAVSSNGSEYTLKTADGDDTVMEYYSTWDESKFADSYSGSSSLSKSME